MNTVTITITKKSDPAMQALLWVARAVSTDKTRYGMDGILFQEHPAEENMVIAVATDARRLHYAELPKWTISDIPGIYISPTAGIDRHAMQCKASRTKIEIYGTHEIQFPNWSRVIPDAPYKIDIPDGPKEFFSCDTLIAIQDAGHQVPCVNSSYMDDIYDMQDRGPDYISYEAPGRAIKFENIERNKMAVLMPAQRNRQ
jgi:hypothetical protein